jgi:flagellar FliL protein
MSNKILIIIIGVVILMMSMMGVGFYILWHKMSVTVAQIQNAGADHKEQKPEETKPLIGTIFKLETMIVNLSDQGGKRYLRVTMQLELSKPELTAELDQRLPQVRDSILMILPTKEFAQINATEGKVQLRDEIIAKLNSFLKSGTITNIYFTEFVVQ